MKHWQPDEDLARAVPVQGRKHWPAGATAGLLAIAIGCAGLAALLYKLAGPRDPFH